MFKKQTKKLDSIGTSSINGDVAENQNSPNSFMKSATAFSGRAKPTLLALAAVALPIFTISNASASLIDFSSGNSTVGIDPTSASGMTLWTVDNRSILDQQSFWIGIGSANWSVSPISSILTSAGTPTVNGPATSLTSTYQTGSLQIQAVYSLVGGAPGSGTADLGEQFIIQNNGNTPVSFHFYQYANFLNVSAVDLTRNSRGLYNEAFVTGPNFTITEGVDTGISPGANHGETEGPGVTLGHLTSGTPGLTLADNMSSTGQNSWAFQWNPTIAAGGTFIISKDINVSGVQPAPEPATWSLVSLGLIGVGFLRRLFGRGKKE